MGSPWIARGTSRRSCEASSSVVLNSTSALPITPNFRRRLSLYEIQNCAEFRKCQKGLSDWIAFGFCLRKQFHSLITVQDARFADCRWCCCLNRRMHLSPRVGGSLDLNILWRQDAPHTFMDHCCEVPPWNQKTCLVVLQRTPNEIAFNCRLIWWIHSMLSVFDRYTEGKQLSRWCNSQKVA